MGDFFVSYAKIQKIYSTDNQIVRFFSTNLRPSLDNYYISGDNSSVIEMLLDRIIHDFSSDGSLVAVVHERHVEDFSMKNFIPCVEWKKYVKMRYHEGGGA